VQLHPVSSLGLVASTPTSLQGDPDEQPTQELQLTDAGVRRLLDVRLNNTSQLAGFAKAANLPYFLRELVGATYRHEPLLAPTQDLLDAYKKHEGDWADGGDVHWLQCNGICLTDQAVGDLP
jgi:hypothetical protein